MKPVVFSPIAMAELEKIWNFIALDDPERATSFVREIRDFCRFVLGSSPGLGVARPDLHVEVRMIPFRRYVVFYREQPTQVEIVLITHGSRAQWIEEFFAGPLPSPK